MDSCTQQTDGESSAQSQEELVPHSPPASTGSSRNCPYPSPLAPEPLATRYSPLATRYSPLATRHSPLAQALAEHTLLSLRVLDPACGSGHFLLAAARRLGKELAKIRTGKDEPDPDHVREAIRDVVSHCLYGVDKNPLAVELCRVALWLEAHCTNKPLTFLDHHIKCGDSLVGVRDLAVLEKGIPDEAFVAVSADDKATASQLKKRNKKERHTLETGQGQLPFDPTDMLAGLREQRQQLEAIADDSPADVRRKKSLYDDYDRDPQRRKLAEACHLWTAAFFQRLKPGAAPSAITTQVITDHLADRRHPQAVAIAEALAVQQHFFHWPLEFPEVFGGMASSEWRVASGSEASGEWRVASGGEASGEWRVASGGEASGEWRVASSNSPLATRDSLLAAFDVVLSNPPWERIKLQEEEFFAGRDARIAQAPNAAARKRLIAGLPVTNPDLWDAYQRALHRAESASRFLRGSRQYPLTGRGDINTYSVFAERIRCLLSSAGRAGIILPTGIATDDTNKSFFADLVEKGHLVSLFDFENREAIFPAVHRSYKFCLLTLTGGSEEAGSEQGASSERRVASSEQGASSEQRVASSDQPLATRHSPLANSATRHSLLAFFATRAEHLRDLRRVFSLTAADIARINPNTRTLPVFRTRQDADLTRAIYERVPVLINEREVSGEVVNGEIANSEKGEVANSEVANSETAIRHSPSAIRPAAQPNPWGVRFLAMFHMSNDSHLFRTRAELEKEGYRLVGNRFVKEASGEQRVASSEKASREQRVASCKEASGERRVASSNSPLATRDSLLANSATRHSSLANTYLPLYEAKMIWHYDHRYGTYEGMDSRSGTQLPTPDGRQHADPQFVVQPWYWVPAEEVAARLGDWQRGWLLGFRDVTNATNERTAIFSLLPKVGAGHTLPILLTSDISALHFPSLLANLNVLAFDWVLRQKIGGAHLTFFILRQLPVLPPAAYSPEDLRFIVPRVLELTYTAWDMQPFADDVWQEADDTLRAAIRTQWEANRREANGEWRVASGREASSEQRVASSEQGASSEQRVASCKEASGERRVASSNSPLATRDSLLANSATRHSPLANSATRHSPLASEPLAPFIWNAARRAQIRAELDAYYARLYGLTRKQLRYILDPADLTERELEDILDPWEERGADSEVASSEQPLATRHSPLAPEPLATRHSPLAPSATRHSPTSHSPSAHTFPGETFRVLKEKEIRQFGEYRTRRLVLEAWARLTGSGNG
ncbi:Eco57I restriction-modification methylase domain-containing protein [Chloracidobacterium aggregatum]|uniref:Eco57I restriction-modification methylase domain-containing protein n=1 Tax=Chloracidobacterium aggregatum TaxID=2851959 RepID=UPI00387EA066